MIKLSIKFEDADGHEYPADVFFNMTRTDLIKLYTTDTMTTLNNISNFTTNENTEENIERLLRATDDVLKLSYGRIVKDPETSVRTFQKRKEWTEEFMGGPLADAVFEKFFWNGNKGLETFITFIQNLIPKDLADDFLSDDEQLQQNHMDEGSIASPTQNSGIKPWATTTPSIPPAPENTYSQTASNPSTSNSSSNEHKIYEM